MEDIAVAVSYCEATGTLVAAWNDPCGFGGLATQAKRLSELEANIRDAVEVRFEPSELPRRIRLHFETDPILAAA